METFLRSIWDSISLVGTALSAPVAIVAAAEALYVGYRRFRRLARRWRASQRPDSAETPVIASSSPAAMLRPAALSPWFMDAEWAARQALRQQWGRILYIGLVILAIPAFIISPGSLVLAQLLAGVLAFCVFVFIDEFVKHRFLRDEVGIAKIVLTVVFIAISVIASAIYNAIIFLIGFVIATIFGFIRGAAVTEVDAIDFRIMAVVFMVFWWFLQSELLE